MLQGMELTAAATRWIDAPPDRLYRYLADFRNHHHRFLPEAFSDFRVLEGGYGTGTVNRFTMTLGGQPRRLRTIVTEPEPGQVLVEIAADGSSRTKFTVTPEGTGARVQIETSWASARGLPGIMERLVAPAMLRRVYAEELELLELYARSQDARAAAPAANEASPLNA